MVMLSKSDYLKGLQCEKLLWVSKNNKDRLPEVSEIDEAKFKDGDLVGEYAKKVFSEGIDLSGLDFKENIRKTKEALGKRVPIFEAGIVFPLEKGSVFSRADVLVPVSGVEGERLWDIIEVKMGTKVKDVNIHDVSFQKFVYEKAGLKIRKCFLMHVNNEYVFDKEIVPEDFFVKTNISEDVLEYEKGIESRVNRMFGVLEVEEPEFCVDDLITMEYDNIVRDEFFDSLPEDNIFQFQRILTKKAVQLYKEGIVLMKDVPDSVKLNDKQKIQRLLAERGGKNVDKEKIKYFLDNLNYPVYYLDFETINSAIPKFDNSKPYQQIPFQFSLHVQDSPGSEVRHVSFLASGNSDPRPKFLQALKDNLGEKGDILVYNQSFEKMVLRQGAESFPEFSEWHDENILPRIKDLMDVFKDFSYYDPKQKGSVSIKYVLPVLSDLKYDGLDIKKGDVAAFEYERVTFGSNDEICGEETKNIDPEEVEGLVKAERLKVRKALEKYCELDTLAEVEIVNELKRIIEKKDGE